MLENNTVPALKELKFNGEDEQADQFNAMCQILWLGVLQRRHNSSSVWRVREKLLPGKVTPVLGQDE